MTRFEIQDARATNTSQTLHRYNTTKEYESDVCAINPSKIS